MPDNVPTLHDPPTIGDRIMHHPELAAALLACLTGILVAWDSWAEPYRLALVPSLVGVPVGVALAVAGATVLWSSLYSLRRQVEQQGWILMITASVLLTGALVLTHSYLLLPVLTLLFPSIAIIRLAALTSIRRSNRRIEEALAKESFDDLHDGEPA